MSIKLNKSIELGGCVFGVVGGIIALASFALGATEYLQTGLITAGIGACVALLSCVEREV